MYIPINISIQYNKIKNWNHVEVGKHFRGKIVETCLRQWPFIFDFLYAILGNPLRDLRQSDNTPSRDSRRYFLNIGTNSVFTWT